MAPRFDLFRRAVQIDQEPVNLLLVVRIESNNGGSDLVVDVADGSQDALTLVACLVIVTKLERLILPRAGAGWHRHTSPDTGIEEDVHLDGRVSPGVQDFSPNYT